MAEKKRKTTRLKELMYGDKIVIRPGVGIAVQAMMAEAIGFDMVSVSGSHTAAHVLGLPDAGLITQTEMVENVRRISSSVGIPVLADCDTGFGNAINVRRTVQLMHGAGAAGIFLEDQVAPKRCGFVAGKEIISIEEAVGKFRAAVDTKNELDPDFVIMARTDARTAVGGGIEETIKRARAYREAGVDVIYVEALQSREEIKAIREAVDGPITCTCQAIQPQPSLQELQDFGLCTASVLFFKVGYVAWWDMLKDMKERGLDPFNEWQAKVKGHPMAGFGVFDLVGFPDVVAWEEKYLPEENLAKYSASSGIYDPRARKKIGA